MSEHIPTSEVMTAAQVLAAAKAKIADPTRWTRKALARDAAGFSVKVRSEAACSFCMVGAVQNVSKSNRYSEDQAITALAEVIVKAYPGRTYDWAVIGYFNDQPETTHAEVMGVFDKALEAEENDREILRNPFRR